MSVDGVEERRVEATRIDLAYRCWWDWWAEDVEAGRTSPVGVDMFAELPPGVRNIGGGIGGGIFVVSVWYQQRAACLEVFWDSSEPRPAGRIAWIPQPGPSTVRTLGELSNEVLVIEQWTTSCRCRKVVRWRPVHAVPKDVPGGRGAGWDEVVRHRMPPGPNTWRKAHTLTHWRWYGPAVDPSHTIVQWRPNAANT